MALDSKQKRGSVLGFGSPWRSWLAEPDGTLANTDRVSLLKWGSAITPSAAVALAPGRCICLTAAYREYTLTAQRREYELDAAYRTYSLTARVPGCEC